MFIAYTYGIVEILLHSHHYALKIIVDTQYCMECVINSDAVLQKIDLVRSLVNLSFVLTIHSLHNKEIPDILIDVIAMDVAAQNSL